jgi:hypothetical protein
MTVDWEPRADMVVTADQLGRAFIIRVTQTGALVRLLDLGGLEVHLLREQLSPIGGSEPVAAVASSATAPRGTARSESLTSPKPSSLSGEVGLRRSIEALRFGLVPDQALEALTVGIEKLSAWSLSRFPCAHAGHPLASAITGPFGAGKSHTMAVIRRLALRQGYIVARVEVDGRAVSLSAPAKLLHQLWSTTQMNDRRSSTPLVDLYTMAVKTGQSAPSIAPRGIDRIKHNYEVVAAIHRAGQVDKHGPLIEALLSSSDEVTAAGVTRALRLERHAAYWDVRPKPMIGSTVADRPYDFVEVLAGHAVLAKMSGFKGLIVTVDEFEVEQMLTRVQYERVNDLLQVLTAYFNDKLEYQAAPLGMFFATVGDDGHEGDQAIAAMVGVSPNARHDLESWSRAQRAELAERIFGVYCASYGITAEFDTALVDNVERQLFAYGVSDSGLVRAFIKRCVALLDAAHGPPWPT